MSQEVTVTIPDISLSSDAKYINYHVQVYNTQTNKTTTLYKRYTDFVTLKQELESFYQERILLDFPGKTYGWTSSTDELLAEERRGAFEKFLQGLLESKDTKWRKSLIFREFFNLPPGTFSNSNLTSKDKMNDVWGLTKEKKPITNTQEWIEVVKESKAILNEAKAGAHNSIGESKKKLIIGRSHIDSLSLGLREQKGQLTDYEFKRREELLDSLKREVEIIQQLQSSSSSSSSLASNQATNTSTSIMTDDKAQLFRGRVLGTPRESSRTVNLDSTQLLQQQRADFQKQDEDLEMLGKTIQRQKELGLAINEELRLQNELLDELDGEVDRVGGKLHYASKRAEKFT